MKDHLEILKEIDFLFATHGLETERQQLNLEISASSTGSELCSRCGSKLLEFQKSNKKAALLIANLIDDFISYCNTNGLYFNRN